MAQADLQVESCSSGQPVSCPANGVRSLTKLGFADADVWYAKNNSPHIHLVSPAVNVTASVPEGPLRNFKA